MNKRVIILLALFSLLLQTGCSSNRPGTGAMIGGSLGGLAGSMIGGGHGRQLAILAGIVTGAMIGNSIGQSMDKTDALMAQHALENNQSGRTSKWINADTGTQYAMTPTKSFRRGYGQYCREYQSEIVVGGRVERSYGTACRQPDGSWEL